MESTWGEGTKQNTFSNPIKSKKQICSLPCQNLFAHKSYKIIACQMQVEEEKQAKESSSKESLIPESDQHQTLDESKQDASDVVKTLEEVDLAKEQAEAVASLSEEFEPRKRVRMLEKEGPTESANELTGSECIQKLEKDEGKEAPVERKSCVKDENGFIYYKCRFCGLTFNFMVATGISFKGI